MHHKYTNQLNHYLDQIQKLKEGQTEMAKSFSASLEQMSQMGNTHKQAQQQT